MDDTDSKLDFMTLSQYASYIQKSKATVTDYKNRGLVKFKPGNSKLVDVVASEQLRHDHFGLSEDSKTKSHYDTQISRIKSEILEAELQEKRGNLVQRSVVEDIAYRSGDIITNQLLQLPKELSRDLLDCGTQIEIEELLKTEINRTLDEFRKTINKL